MGREYRVFSCALSLVAAAAIQVRAEPDSPAASAEEQTMQKTKIDHARNHHKVVSLTSLGIIPRTAKFKEDDAIAWLNYLSQQAEVSFDSAVAEKLTCDAPGLFSINSGRLRASVDELGFASLCHLAPGEYEYAVSLLPSGELAEKYTGKIVVE